MTDAKKKDLIRPLEHLNGRKPPAPDWFEWAINAPSEEGAVEVAGANIRYSAWGERGRKGLIFVHGGRAHRNWWRPFAPFLASEYRVAAFDMSGMGDSDWRESYNLDCAIDEIFAVIDATGVGDVSRPILIGHSFGGWMTLASVEKRGAELGGAVVIDSPIAKPDPDEGYTILKKSPYGNEGEIRQNRVYASIEEPISRFRFLPNQPCDAAYMVDYIAREGLTNELKSGENGWSWKFDPAQGSNFDIHFDRDLFLAARCPLAFIYGGDSAFAKGEGYEAQKSHLAGRAPFIEIPSVHHHLMMEEPIAFISVLRTLLSSWPIRAGF